MFSFCPQCGHRQANVTPVRPFTCEACAFTFYQNTAAAVAGIIEVNRKILFTRRAKHPAKDRLDLPGGFVDPNESLENALSRELQEELGFTLHQWQYLGSWANQYPYRNVTYHTCDAVFYCQTPQQPNIKVDPDEISQYIWLPLHDINISDIAFPSLQNAMHQYLQMQFVVG